MGKRKNKSNKAKKQARYVYIDYTPPIRIKLKKETLVELGQDLKDAYATEH